MDFLQQIKHYSGQPLTRQLLLDLLKEYSRPHDKINELVKKGILISVKRGLFIPGTGSGIEQPEPFLIANHVFGPSYISMESALSHWGMIPEQVFEISSVTTARSKTYDTAVGIFSYLHLPLPYFSFGQQSIELAPKQFVLIASVEKALCDKIIGTSGLVFRSTIQMLQWLMEDMRIEKTMLSGLDISKIESWIPAAPKKESLKVLIKAIEKI